MSWFFRPFRTLQWRLTLTYVLVTVLTVLTLEGMLLAALDLIVVNAPQHSHSLVDQIRPIAAESSAYLTKGSPNTAALNLLVQQMRDSRYVLSDEAGIIARTANTMLVMVLDVHGNVIASAPDSSTAEKTLQLPGTGDSTPSTGVNSPSAGTSAPQLQAVRDLPQSRSIIQAALAGAVKDASLQKLLPDGRTVVFASPIQDFSHQVLGALFVEAVELPVARVSFLNSTWFILLPSAILLTVGAIFVGTIFGWLTARWLTRRLRVLTGAANAWSRGDFGAMARDSSNDELGQLARHLNGMAAEIEALLQERQDLAVIEERNRLARDLHDSVKQQVFATAMQLAAAHNLLERDPSDAAAAQTHVAEAQSLTSQAQQELTALIQELRPVALEDKGLASALEGYSRDWSRQTGIASTLRVQGEQETSLEIEQALFRVAQEALANIARHSHASKADVHLLWDREGLGMTIQDNGHGFDMDRADGKGTGLWSMRQRIAAVAGTLRISSSTGGTRLEVHVPIIGAEHDIRSIYSMASLHQSFPGLLPAGRDSMDQEADAARLVNEDGESQVRSQV
jgi:NarL family two-component system sensor histidine kinase LiaS